MLRSQILPNACAGSKVRYGVDSPVSGSQYFWYIDGTGSIISHYQNNDSVDIQWGNDAGSIKLSVFEVNASGCIGDTAKYLVNIIGNNYNIGDDQDACQNQPYLFEVSSTEGLASMRWNHNNSLSNSIYNGIAKATTETIYFEAVTSSGCKIIDSALLKGHPIPEFSVSFNGKSIKDTMLCGSQVLDLVASSANKFIEYKWTSDDNNVPEYVSNYKHAPISPSSSEGIMKVYLVASNDFCSASDTFGIIRCIPPTMQSIPNAIIPGSEISKNRSWNINELEFYPEATVDVYDRWGRLVFHTENGYNNTKAWDGKSNGVELPMDNYFYIIRLDSKSKPIVGNIMIIK